jgi:hypothetical protein
MVMSFNEKRYSEQLLANAGVQFLQTWLVMT